MKYTDVADVYYGDYDPEGNAVNGFVTVRVNRSGTFGGAVVNLVMREQKKTYLPNSVTLLMTTRQHWSGYSEYTVTNQWSEIILTVPEWNWEREWPSLGDFLRAVADANPESDR